MSVCVPDTFTPSPTNSPVGDRSPLAFSLPGCDRSMYSRSWKFVRLPLNPVVFTFARLLAMTSSLVLRAESPVAAAWSAIVAMRPLSSAHPAQAVNRPVHQAVGALDHGQVRLRGPARLGHGQHRPDGVYG